MGKQVAIPAGVRPIYAQTTQMAREAIGEEAFQAACNEGSRMTVEKAIDLTQGQKFGN